MNWNHGPPTQSLVRGGNGSNSATGLSVVTNRTGDGASHRSSSALKTTVLTHLRTAAAAAGLSAVRAHRHRVDGGLFTAGRYEVSPDGKTLTVTNKGIGLKGPFEVVMVLERVPNPH